MEIRIRDDGVVRGVPLGLLDVLGPGFVVVGRVDRQAHDLDVSQSEGGLDVRHVAEFGGADGREVLRMGEQHRPGVPDPVVKPDRPLGRLRLEVRCCVADLESHLTAPLWSLDLWWSERPRRRLSGSSGRPGVTHAWNPAAWRLNTAMAHACQRLRDGHDRMTQRTPFCRRAFRPAPTPCERGVGAQRVAGRQDGPGPRLRCVAVLLSFLLADWTPITV